MVRPRANLGGQDAHVRITVAQYGAGSPNQRKGRPGKTRWTARTRKADSASLEDVDGMPANDKIMELRCGERGGRLVNGPGHGKAYSMVGEFERAGRRRRKNRCDAQQHQTGKTARERSAERSAS